MQDFVSSFGFILAFLVGVLLFHALFGEKVTTGFLVLVLASMLLTNPDTFSNWIGGVSHV